MLTARRDPPMLRHMSHVPRRKHTDLIKDLLPLQGRLVVEVGCGDGALVRFMTRHGARVVGLDCNEAVLTQARTTPAEADEEYQAGRGESLPFADRSVDVVLYFNSLHHVPIDLIERALAEAARVLKPQGWLYVMEPLAEGAYFDIVRLVEDETEERAAAYRAIRAARGGAEFAEETEVVYAAPFRLDGFEAFKRRIIAANPARAGAVAALEPDLLARFEAACERHDDGCWFVQPSRLNLLRRR